MFAQFIRSTLALTIATGATLVIVAGSAAPATAATAPAYRTATIDTRAYNLNHPAGRAELDARIARTARRLCDTGDTQQLAAAQAMRACVARATAAAAPRVEALAGGTPTATRVG